MPDHPANRFRQPAGLTAEVAHIGVPRTWGVRGIDGPFRASVDVTVEPLADTDPA